METAQKGDNMRKLASQPEISIDKVLFATDFSPATEAAFSHALAIAGHYHSTLYVAHVINPESFDLFDTESAQEMIKQAHDEAVRKITHLLAPLRLTPDRYEIVVGEGAVSEVLIETMETNDIDLAVLGTHGRRAFKKLLMGSIAEEVFRMARCPVLTLGPKTPPATPNQTLRHILYPVEFAPDSTNAAAYAVSLAERYGAALTVMNVKENSPAAPNIAEPFAEPFERWINSHLSQGSDLRNRIRFERGFGHATDSILDFTDKADVDLIVMSVHELDPVIAAHLPKPDTAYELVSRAHCPVLTIR